MHVYVDAVCTKIKSQVVNSMIVNLQGVSAPPPPPPEAAAAGKGSSSGIVIGIAVAVGLAVLGQWAVLTSN